MLAVCIIWWPLTTSLFPLHVDSLILPPEVENLSDLSVPSTWKWAFLRLFRNFNSHIILHIIIWGCFWKIMPSIFCVIFNKFPTTTCHTFYSVHFLLHWRKFRTSVARDLWIIVWKWQHVTALSWCVWSSVQKMWSHLIFIGTMKTVYGDDYLDITTVRCWSVYATLNFCGKGRRMCRR